MRLNFRVLLVGLITFAYVLCSPGNANAQQRSGPSRDIRFLQDVSYNSAPDADPKYQVSDLYLPAGKRNFPMLFFIHGGGWRAGDKVYDGLEHIVNICYDLGIGVMSINYRMGKNVTYQTEMRDTAMAFAWLHKNAAQYGADPNIIFVMGGSAGAHMAALFGADPRYLQEQGLSPKNIKEVGSDVIKWPIRYGQRFYAGGRVGRCRKHDWRGAQFCFGDARGEHPGILRQ
jgi:alpha/beta hydrolase fold